MELNVSKEWDCSMPLLLDCLRRDIYELVTKLDLPQEQQMKIGKLIEQIRLEEAKYENSIRTTMTERSSSMQKEIDRLKRVCDLLQNEVNESKTACSPHPTPSDNTLHINDPTSRGNSAQSNLESNERIETAVKRISAIKEDVMNIAMEMRLSIEMEMKSCQSSVDLMSQTISTLIEKYKSQNLSYMKECQRRKKLFDELQVMRGNIRVFCRVRPLIDSEIERKENSVIEVIDDASLLIKLSQTTVDSGKGRRNTEKIYEYDRVFGVHSTQSAVYNEMEGIAISVLDGYSACVFAYGQTGSGKTYTMEGKEGDEVGITFRTLTSIYNEIQRHPDVIYTVSIAMVEIYNEKVYDLLGGNLQVEPRLSSDGHVILPNACNEVVESLEGMKEVLRRGNSCRRVAATASNEHSSRSHMLFIATIKGENTLTKQKSEGKLILIDLAGSERVSKTESTGQRLVEGQYINKSLSSLGDVIHALHNKQKHIPFRNSMLTFLLQDSLSEGSKVLMIVQLSPAASNQQESLQSLEFANRVNRVVLGKGVENKTHAMVSKLNDQNSRLKAELQTAREELSLLHQKASLSSDSLNQIEKQINSLQLSVQEKAAEILKCKMKMETMEQELSNKNRQLQEKVEEQKELSKKYSILEKEKDSIQQKLNERESISRDSMGSLLNTTMKEGRRLSSIGVRRVSVGPKPVEKDKEDSDRTHKRASNTTSPVAIDTNKSRLSLVQRSKILAAKPAPAPILPVPTPAPIVSGRVAAYKPQPTRKSLAARYKPNRANSSVKSVLDTSSTDAMNATKKMKYTVSVPRNGAQDRRADYTFTPSNHSVLDTSLHNGIVEPQMTSFIQNMNQKKNDHYTSFIS